MSAHLQRARVLFGQGRHRQAEADLRLHLAQDPEDGHAHGLLALCLVDRQAWAEAGREADQAVAHDPGLAWSHYVQAVVLHDRNRLDEAATAIAEAIRLDPDDADYRAVLAQVETGRQRWGEALAAAEAGLALDPTHVPCANLRIASLRQLGRTGEAQAASAEVLGRAPEDANAHANLGWSRLQAREHEQAVTSFREALRLEPDNEFARHGLVEAIKARNVVYRGMLGYYLWMSRQGFGVRIGIVVGSYVAVQALFALVERRPDTGWWAWPVLALLIVFVWSTWLCRPASNLLLRFHPLGRHALDRDDRIEAAVVGSILLAGAGVAAWEWFGMRVWLLPLLVLLIAIPATCVRLCQPGWPRLAMGAVAAVIALWGLGLVALAQWAHHLATEAQAERLVSLIVASLDPYLYTVLASQFLVIPLSRVRPRR